MITSVGKLLIEKALPPKYREGLGEIDGNAFQDLFTRIAKEDPDQYQDIMADLMEMSKEAVTTYGHEASFSLKDLALPPAMKKYRQQAKAEVKLIVNNPRFDRDEKEKKIVEAMFRYMKIIPDKVMEEAYKMNNGLATQVKAGARGNKMGLTQLLFGDILIVDAENKPVPIPGLNGYGSGTNPLEYWASSSGARKGSIDLQFATANSGYLGKQLNNIGHRTMVTEEDCATTNGYAVAADDPDNIGTVLANDVRGVKAGTLITPKVMKKLGKSKVIVRSPITCEAKDGICSKCSGHREDNDFPVLGEVVGAVAARAMSEPITQASLRSKHTGGVAGTDDEYISGFEAMNQFMQVPKVFRGGAAIAQKDGLVERVEKAAGGGHNIIVGNEKHYVPRGMKLKVKRGERVIAGDILSTGVPSPAEIVKFKGIGEGRRYFVEQFSKMLKQNKAGLHRRNVEAMARGFINRIKITDPDGYGGYMIGDVLPYDDLVKYYEPRDGSLTDKPRKSRNKFLEKPILHYSIGTKITPSVIKTLSSHGIDSIVVNEKPPPFEPMVVKARDILETDPDWITRLGGENLKRATLAAAQRGATSKRHGTSYFPAVAKGSDIGKTDKGFGY